MAQLLDYLSEKYQPDTFDEVNRRLVELSSLLEISQLLNESLELSRVLNNILYIPMGRLMISRGAIILREEEVYRVVMAKGIAESLKTQSLKLNKFPQKFFYFKNLDATDKTDTPSELIKFGQEAKLDIAVPIISNNRPLGLMLYGAKLNKTPFNEDEINFLNSLANLSATTIANALHLEEIKQINRRLDERIHELKTLFDIARGLSSTLDFPKIMKLLVYALMGQMLVTRYAILLKDNEHFANYENKGFDESVIDSIGEKLVNIDTPESAILISQIPNSSIVNLLEKNGVRAVIPMQHQDKLIGFILLGSKISGQEYTEADTEFLTTLVSQAVISLENARLFQETLEKQRIEEELNVARTIQKRLLPKTLPKIEGYEVYGMNNSSRQVGGDYFDVIQIDENRWALAIGDVSGKGVPASLLMANLQSALRVMMTPDLVLSNVAGKLNTLIYNNTTLDKFITFFIAVIDIKKHTLEYVNAGHNNPIYLTANGEQKLLDIGGILLGIMPQYTYQTGKIDLQKNELILAYTDGVNEATNSREEEFGEERLYELVKSQNNRSVNVIIEEVLKAINEFSAGQPQADDVTMLGIRRLS